MSEQLAQWNSGTTRESNPGHRVPIPTALTTKPLNLNYLIILLFQFHLLRLLTSYRRYKIQNKTTYKTYTNSRVRNQRPDVRRDA